MKLCVNTVNIITVIDRVISQWLHLIGLDMRRHFQNSSLIISVLCNIFQTNKIFFTPDNDLTKV